MIKKGILFDIYQCIDLFKVIIQPTPLQNNKKTDPQVISKWYDFP